MDQELFRKLLDKWYELHHEWLNEQNISPKGRKQYVHRKTRRAYRSLVKNVDLLFACRKYSHLRIPNTTNQLEGLFGHIKPIISPHRGISKQLKHKMFAYLCLESR